MMLKHPKHYYDLQKEKEYKIAKVSPPIKYRVPYKLFILVNAFIKIIILFFFF